MRGWMVAGNWKMNNTIKESIDLSKAVKEGTDGIKGGEVVLSPPFTALQAVYETIKGSHVMLAAQNMFYEEKGAYTGETSAAMLKDVGCTYVIIGHSERRKYFGETDEWVNLKTKKSLSVGLKPIICVGETDAERERGITEFVVGIQVKKALNGIDSMDNIVIAYEPVWAIGTGKTATPEIAEKAHQFIRKKLSELFDKKRSNKMSILYGGSVKPDNIKELIKKENIDGVLVGGASLEVKSFLQIIEGSEV